MAAYFYEALDRQGKRVRGVIEAESPREVASQLRPQGLVITSIKVKKSAKTKEGVEKKKTRPQTQAWGRVKTKDVIVFSRQFATLINAGLPVVQALGILVDQTENPVLKNIVSQVRKDVEEGVPLSGALAKHPKVFDRLFYNMVKAGEMGGVLDVILTRLAGYMEAAENIKQKMKSAMRYPIFVMIMAIGLTSGLVFFIMPKMEKLFKESFQVQLPALTQFMLDLSRLARDKIWMVGIFVGALFGAYYLLKKSDKGSYLIDSLKIKIPVLGQLFHKIALSRFARTLATLSNSGVPILDALDMTAKTSGNRVVEKAIEEAKSSLKEGEAIADPLKDYPIFPPMVVSMIAVGEETGALDEMLNKIADFYDQEVETMVDSLASLIEPLLIGFLGATVGVVVVAMYLPYFTMFKHIGR